LGPNGRLGFVLPAELLATHYAGEVRSFLLRRFGSLKIVVFKELVFPGVMEEVILLLAEGSGGCNSFEIIQVKNADCLDSVALRGKGYCPPHPNHKWTASLLHQEAHEILISLTQSKTFEPLKNWGDVYLGFVTGNNAFFTMGEGERINNNISEKDVVRICPPGARKLDCIALTNAVWKQMRDNEARTYLFYPRSNQPDRSSEKYIEKGRRLKVHTGYKCANRDPWWRVPIPEEPDLIFTYMNYQMPRLISNEARLQVPNSMYGIKLHRNRKLIARKGLPQLFCNSVSALSSEIEGRSYGGGLLKHEPREADQILVPSLALTEELINKRETAQSSRTYNTGQVHGCCVADELLLTELGNLPIEAMHIVQSARTDLFTRRAARNKSMSNRQPNEI
jgi:adenine-specific DNA-methyltransferase